MTPDELTRHIPPEVVEEAAIKIGHHYYGKMWSLLSDQQRDLSRAAAFAALAAGLAAWPDSILMPAELILPLPQEGE